MLIFLLFVVLFDIFISPRLIGNSGVEVVISGMTEIWWCCDDIEAFSGLNICFFGAYTEPVFGKVCQIFGLLALEAAASNSKGESEIHFQSPFLAFLSR